MHSSGNHAAAIKLPLKFDPVDLRADLEGISAEHWIPHFNTDNYQGEWSGIALRGPANVTHPIQSLFANPDTKEWANTSFYHECPAFAKLMTTFQCELLSVRLLRLGPGAVIKEHVDHSLAIEDGEVRLHVPVQTNQQIQFWLDGEKLPLRAGETWYMNVNLPHRVENNSLQHRVHLVLDCKVNSWLLEQMGMVD